MKSCHFSLGIGTTDKSAENHKPPQSRTIAQNNIKIVVDINKQNDSICSALLSLKYSFGVRIVTF